MKFLDLTGLQYFYDKYLRPLKDAAFKNVANNLTTTEDGSVLDARQGKALNDNKIGKSNVVNNLTTTESGFALDARQGKELDDKITELNSNKIDTYNISIDTGEFLTGETFVGRPVYEKLVDIGVLPNATQKTVSTGISNADYFWIDPTYSMIFNTAMSYPMPYNDPQVASNGVTARIVGSGTSVIVHTAADWSTYSAYVAVKYTKK